ncbi:EpsD family peptidyl-prolyl cis-trans isomerase [Immundisolibacter sp.]|uniref:EpsD family peptidyl-prolyl cis-trans isomerase n=1 Tax=Immundisolibacter sp. TaxID=1934948 RepID=UPI002B11C190|nr:EpsD family peptidyl-prolyl cis-trans isomerase [Immundisolibacter sp.]MEA3221424.1 hypothetical protein [Immundisolibacter sp.]
MGDARSQVGIALLKRLVVTGALIAGLTGCGGGQDEVADKAGQAVATVNGEDVTVHQLNYLLARLPGAAQAPDPVALKRQAADQLVTRQLLLERALAQKLDRDPAVMLALEESRQQLLAQAHLERVMAQAVPPTDDEIRKYYDEHPLKYAQRKLFLMRQVATDNTVPREELDAYGKGEVTAESLVKWLQERGAKVRVSIRTLPSEQVPEPILERLQTLKPGQAIMVGSATESTVSFLVEARDAPITLEQAKDSIRQTLLNERRQALGEQEVKHLREQADIKWLGEFADQPPTPAEGAVPAPQTQPAPAVDSEQEDNDDDGIGQGLKGLR